MPDITIPSSDGEFGAYLALPTASTGAAIIVIQEIFGVNAYIRDLCDSYAAAGYVAIAPDLFWRQEPGVQITDKTDAEWKKAFGLYKGFSETFGVQDLITTLAFIRQHPAVTGKVGCLGYCLGGKLAYLLSTRSDIDASVSFHGVGIENQIGEVASVTHPLLLIFAGNDAYVPPETRAAILDAVAGNSLIDSETYADRDHGFTRTGSVHYHGEDAVRANARSAAFFKQHLG